MFAKKPVIVLASAFLAAEAIAVNMHRHGHQHLHNLRDLKYAHTEVIVHTEWVTITVFDDEVPTTSPSVVKTSSPTTTKSSASSSSSSAAPPPPPPPPPPAETISTPAKEEEKPTPTTTTQAPTPPAVKAPPAAQVPAPAPVSSSPPPPVNSPPPSGGAPSGGNKRGLAYNEISALPPFMGSGSKISWCYNWGQTDSGKKINAEFVPMLWGPIDIHTSTWARNAEAAISNGAKALLSFNECDMPSQCNKDPATAAREHIRLMNPYAGKVRIGSPAVSNSNIAGQGLDWLRAWVKECNGNCAFDFCAAHWYSPPVPKDFLNHMKQVQEACQGKPVWITEFAPISGDHSVFLKAVMSEMDSNPEYNFIERYSYFYAHEGHMLSGGSPNTQGTAFAYS